MVFIDLEKAYDKVRGVSHGGAWKLKDICGGAKTSELERLEVTRIFSVEMGLHEDRSLALFYLPW
ncbi:hypothetical protein H5410_004445 [Solanum commersonii]|uniref:Uncharacterized protein n=1 Tax=Solanum commersonii TaxID=4109 RepID=A0A9J6B7P4_SOLCO|nr:hypothetical protein H5410_004445 [Solanum commersonii]